MLKNVELDLEMRRSSREMSPLTTAVFSLKVHLVKAADASPIDINAAPPFYLS